MRFTVSWRESAVIAAKNNGPDSVAAASKEGWVGDVDRARSCPMLKLIVKTKAFVLFILRRFRCSPTETRRSRKAVKMCASDERLKCVPVGTNGAADPSIGNLHVRARRGLKRPDFISLFTLAQTKDPWTKSNFADWLFLLALGGLAM